MKSKIYIRADGNSEIGLGHVIRSLALAEMLKEEFRCTFATRFLTDYINREARKVCDEVIKLPESEEHFDAFLAILSGDEIVVLDNYFFTTMYQQKIKDKGCKLVCIDDIHDTHFMADVVINHSSSVLKSDYSVESYTTLCLGLNYALLRPAFFNTLQTQKLQKDSKTFFVCFGGSDFCDLTQQTLEVLLKYHYTVYAVIGDSNRNRDKLLSKYSHNNNVVLLHDLPAKEMAEVMQKSDMAIVPASSVLLEVWATKTPAITGYFVDNQKEGCLHCVNNGWALYVDMLHDYKTNLEKLLVTIDQTVCNKLRTANAGLIKNPQPLFLNVFKKLMK